MGVLRDTYTLFIREMLIFKKNLRVNVIRSIIFPIVLILLLGNIGNAPLGVPIAVVNYANNPASLQFVSAVSKSNAVSVYALTTQDAAMQMLAEGQVTIVAVISPTFGTAGSAVPGVTLYVDASSPLASGTSIAVIQNAAASLNSRVTTSSVGSSLQSSGTSVVTNSVYGASSNYKSFLIAGIIIMVTAFGSIWGGGLSMLTDRQLGNLKAFMATPISNSAILMAKVVSGTLQSVIYGILAFGIGILDGGTVASGIAGMPIILWFMLLAALGFSSLAAAIASRISKMEVYMVASMSIVMPQYFLAGAFFPTATLPAIIRPFGTYNPLTFAIDGVRSLMLKGTIPFQSFLVDTTAMLIFTGLMVALSIIMFKKAK